MSPRPAKVPQIRTAAGLGIILLATTLAGAGFAATHPLTFEERVHAQAAIERVYYSHQLGATLPFEQAVPRSVLEGKVRTYLKQTVALERFWSTPVTEEMLARELERMARQTRMPERLREIYAALGNDPALIAESLARPALVDRLSRSFFSHDETIQASARRTAGELRDRLVAGRIDPLAEDPDRALVEYLRTDLGGTHSGSSDEALAGTRAKGDAGAGVVELPAIEFDQMTSRLPRQAGQIGPLEEEGERFLIRVALEREPERARVATYAVAKRSWDDWWREAAAVLDAGSVAAVASTALDLPTPETGPACADDTWNNGGLDDTPLPRHSHTAVWTGTRMIIWSGAAAGVTGALYDPTTDTWTPTSTINAPQAHSRHVAVWDGREMLVWGGGNALNTGGRYDPAADTWTPMSTVGAPAGRVNHTAVWTGTKMVIWGGSTDPADTNTGGRYDPASDTWAPTSTLLAPSARSFHTAVWTGSQMIVWGGSLDTTGGLYDPDADVWTPTSLLDAPVARIDHTAIWTGSEMVVWGGSNSNFTALYNTGGRYDPVSDTWAPTSTLGAPSSRTHHTAIWTGSTMIVWGARTPATGGRYDPATDAWTATSLLNAPEGRRSHTAIWTGSMMVVWGGADYSGHLLNTGGRYDPAADAWTPTSTGGAPSPRSSHLAVWTGSVMIVWGGRNGPYTNTGGRYDPAIDSWAPTSTVNAPLAHGGYSVVWTGSRMIVWGGVDSTGNVFYNSGGRYDPIGDTWSPTATANAPYYRTYHTAVWTGSHMVIWGGSYYIPPPLGRTFYLDSGGRYDPVADAWTPTSTVGAPAARVQATSVWTGSVVVVWGGWLGDPGGGYLIVGGRYDPVADSWTATTATNAPTGRTRHTAVWTGSRMVVWGGGPYLLNPGGQYDPAGDLWTSTSLVGAPSGREGHFAVWSGDEMLVWGADSAKTGGRYDPVADAWVPTSLTGAPAGYREATGVWVGDSMVVWGGNANDPGANFNVGGRYCACTNDTYYLDADGDGIGDPGVSTQTCGAPVGYVTTGGDCDDGDAALWGTPSEIPDLSVPDAATIAWQAPTSPGGATVLYDLIRSGTSADFVAAGTCLVSGGPDLFAADAEIPSSGQLLAYLARARNGCPGGQGSLGTDSNGTPRVGLACP